MATASSHNKKSSSVKRILSEARELAADTSSEYTAAPLEDNIFEWHFTLRGPSSSEFENGLYHGRILLPAEYPMRPPSLLILTPNGRWELNKKICLTFTGYHEEMWQPAWGIRTALLGIQTFMTARAEAAVGIGALNYSVEVREKLAKESRTWTCPTCKCSNLELLPDPDPTNGPRKVEALPGGLTIDTSRTKIKEAESSSATDAQVSSGGAVAAAAASVRGAAVAAAVEITAAPPAPADARPPGLASSDPAPAVSTARSGPGPRPIPTVPAAVVGAVSSPARHPAAMHISESQQKLALIDRCIALLAALVALLVLKRLV
ncbi:hypothetical protein ACQY0O_000223 [Thecaphora frezii]